ncbi:hypothetical protein BDW02DRAFT_566794 [Decorospora gaudefroyi]|uniref:Uncharacterized protein n=1 Tax=Decorospora gaudefroyi TaxID=184978 RepID=A0A6A5KSU2_9PLEO|nr:hypothetical protein BDW02DRAFT_566794 [Decorospora gaudefroyi]
MLCLRHAVVLVCLGLLSTWLCTLYAGKFVPFYSLKETSWTTSPNRTNSARSSLPHKDTTKAEHIPVTTHPFPS